MRPLLAFVALFLAAGCAGDDDWAQATETTSWGVSFAVDGVPADQTELRTMEQPPGPTSGWAAGVGGVEFFVRAPKQTVDHPAKLTFTIDAGRFDDVTRGEVDQLGVFAPGGLILFPAASSMCDRAGGRADPDPCIASREFLENGDGRIVVLASDPTNG